MKKPDQLKLALRRETLAALCPEVLAAVAGGDIGPGGGITTNPKTSRIDACPSRLFTCVTERCVR